MIDRLRHDQLARIDPQNVGKQPLAGRLRNPEGPRRDVDPGKRIGVFCAAPHPAQRHQVAGFGRREQLFLGDRAGRHQPHHVALHHRLGAALLRFRRVLDLFAHCDAMALRDQLLQIVVGGVDRHAAHRNVLALVLAALRQRDAERAAGDLRVLEEQLVEVAHAVEQQRIGIRPLDLDELLHHRRRTGRRQLGGTGGCGRVVVQFAKPSEEAVFLLGDLQEPSVALIDATPENSTRRRHPGKEANNSCR